MAVELLLGLILISSTSMECIRAVSYTQEELRDVFPENSTLLGTGKRRAHKIGKNIGISDEWPLWFVKVDTGSCNRYCSGFAIRNSIVVTAADCVHNPRKAPLEQFCRNVSVLIPLGNGKWKRFGFPDDRIGLLDVPGNPRQTAEISVLKFDFSIYEGIYHKRELPFLGPCFFPKTGEVHFDNMYATGVGDTCDNCPNGDTIFSAMGLHLEECYPGLEDSERKVCTLDGLNYGRTCPGDQGGPLVKKDAQGQDECIVGLVAGGLTKCNLKGQVDVFIRLDIFWSQQVYSERLIIK